MIQSVQQEVTAEYEQADDHHRNRRRRSMRRHGPNPSCKQLRSGRKQPDQNGVGLRNRVRDINGLAQNPIGYRFTIASGRANHRGHSFAARHDGLTNLRIARGVVRSLPTTSAISRVPAAAALRNDESVNGPCGKTRQQLQPRSLLRHRSTGLDRTELSPGRACQFCALAYSVCTSRR
jgi:hypothetical protein